MSGGSPYDRRGSASFGSLGSLGIDDDQYGATQCTQMDATQGDGSVGSDTRSPHPAPWSSRLVSIDQDYDHIDLGDVETVTFGRAKGSTVRIDLPTISGTHCRISRRNMGREYWVEDLSSNGTFINKVKLGRGNHAMLQQGDVLCLLKVSVRQGTDKCSWMFRSKNPLFDADQEDTVVSSKYHMMQELGRGGFSVVRLAVEKKTGEKYAMKIIDKARFYGKTKKSDALAREVKILRKLRHPNITRVFDVIDSPKRLYIVLEYAGGGELFDLVKERPRTETEARYIVRQLLQAVEYLHDNNLVHRDLKLENVLLDSRIPGASVKLTDFGLSRMVGSSELLKTQCGTPIYVAPEIFALSAPNRAFDSQPVQGYDQAVDMWAVGVIVYVCLAGFFPWSEEDHMHQHIQNGTFSFAHPVWDRISSEAKMFIRALLTVSPEERATAEEALNHPWLKEEEFARPTPPRPAGNELENDESLQSTKRKLDLGTPLRDRSERQQKRLSFSPSSLSPVRSSNESLN